MVVFLSFIISCCVVKKEPDSKCFIGQSSVYNVYPLHNLHSFIPPPRHPSIPPAVSPSCKHSPLSSPVGAAACKQGREEAAAEIWIDVPTLNPLRIGQGFIHVAIRDLPTPLLTPGLCCLQLHGDDVCGKVCGSSAELLFY